MSRTIQGYGFRPSLPDHRDLIADASGIKVAREVDPRADMTPIYDQGQIGSCTGQAVAGAVDYHRIVGGQAPFYPARLAIYSCERIIEGQSLDADTGAYGRDGFKAATKYGLLREVDYPYSDQAPVWQDDPRDELAKAEMAGGDHFTRLHSPYKAVPRRLSSFKAVLSNHQTIAFGFSVYQSFETNEVAKTGIMPLPGPGEKIVGGHEVLAIGYLAREPNHVLVRNSWGTGWGMNGYLLMPWAVLLDASMSSDFRTIYRPAS